MTSGVLLVDCDIYLVIFVALHFALVGCLKACVVFFRRNDAGTATDYLAIVDFMLPAVASIIGLLYLTLKYMLESYINLHTSNTIFLCDIKLSFC